MIKSCTCVSEFQDAQYGKGMRLFNSPGKAKKEKKDGAISPVSAKCTVCGKKS